MIDIGTRGVRCLIASVASDGNLCGVVTDGALGGLGAGMDANGFLSESSMAHVAAIVQRFKGHFLAQQVDSSVVVCTQVVRVARNAEVFLDKIRQILPDVFVLTPEEEADFSFRAASFAFAGRIQAGDRILVIDQGGGSAELSTGKLTGNTFPANERCYASLHIGTVALSTLILNSPTLLKGCRAADHRVQEAIETNSALDILLSEPPTAIFGMGSAIRKFAEKQSGIKYAHGVTVSFVEIENAVAAMHQLVQRERDAALVALKADAPTITTACGLLTFYHALQKYNSGSVIFCREGLSYGVLRLLASQDATAADRI